MSETQPQPVPHGPKTASKPIDTPLTPWTFRAQHRRLAVVWLIILLIVLQLVFAGLVAVQIWRLLDLGERIERLEKKQTSARPAALKESYTHLPRSWQNLTR